MAKLYPSKQTFVDTKDGIIVGISHVKILTATSDNLELPRTSDAAILNAARETSDPTFYLSQNKTDFNIDGATVGTEYIVVSRHDGSVNYNRGTADADNPR